MRSTFIAPAALIASLVTSAVAWVRLPDRVPVHIDLHGQVDRWGSRLELIIWGPLSIALVWGLLALLTRIDPKVRQRDQALKGADPETAEAERRNDRSAREAFVGSVLLVIVFVHGGLLAHAAGLLRDPVRFVSLGIAAFMVVGGNFMGRIRPNWFIGIRTPWTLSDDEVWRRTHRLAGRLMVVCGIVLAVLSPLLPTSVLLAAMVALVLSAMVPPIVASYVLWKRRSVA
jgi:uncharacterized membrane protein